VGVVGKVLRILEALDAAPSGLQLRQISQVTGVQKSTAYRFLAHLEGDGYLFRDDAGAYVIGPRLARLGAGVAYHATLRKVSRPAMQHVWRETKETVNLAALDGHEIVYLDVLESDFLFRMGSQVGMRRPLYCTALGKAILAFLPEDQIEELISSMTFEQLTRRTINDEARLRRELGKIRQQGYAVDDQELNIGGRCVAVPVFEERGKAIAAISVAGPATRMTRARIPECVAILRKGAREISTRLDQLRN
jgi:DNA-binding IclR family transcriptional regulator